MSSQRGAQVRAFSVDGERGNPAFVFLTEPDERVDVQACIAVAARTQSEVTWIHTGSTRSGIGLRFFTAGGEIAFCGHGTLAAAAWLADRDGARKELLFDVGGISLRVAQDEHKRWWYPQEEAGSHVIDSNQEIMEAELALGLPLGRLIRASGVRLARSVGALREKILLELPTASDLRAIAVNAARRDAFCERLQATGIYVFSICRDVGAPRILARHFPLHSGEQEDMATGGIAPTIVRYAAFSEVGRDVVIEQGGPDCRNSRIVVSHAVSGSARKVAGECVVGADETITGMLTSHAKTIQRKKLWHF